MAKSLRSKKKRKMRAEKRIVNAKKELVKLKEVVAKLHGKQQLDKETLEENMPDVSVTVNGENQMLVDGVPDHQYSGSKGKTSVQINTNWMNQRRIKAIKNKIKHHNRKKARRPSSAGLSSRRSKRRLK